MVEPKLPACKLKQCIGDRLIGAVQTPLPILRYANFNLIVSGKKLSSEVIIFYSLNAEGMLGLDFLENNQSTLTIVKDSWEDLHTYYYV